MFKSTQEINRGFLHKQFDTFWRKMFTFHDDGPDANELITSLKILEKSDLVRPEIILVYSFEKFEPLYISKNSEQIIGFSVEELMKTKSYLFFKLLAFKQISSLFKITKWAKAFWESEKKKGNQPTKIETHFCGIRSKTMNGDSKTFLLRFSYNVGPNYEIPKHVVFYFSDITHFFRGNFYWALFRSIGSKNTVNSKLHSSEDSRRESTNLITNREKEILIQFSEGKSNKEIGEFLKISKGTVEKHRRNMLERTGARDTTALVHFCKLCKIL